MEDEELAPDPDAILKAITREENLSRSGRLKIFFGMSAGVGKTYAMLQEAHLRQQEGIKLVIGTINTHGRIETERLLEGLPVIPEKQISYKGTVLSELNLEAILEAKPELVLVDELAHTNAPGSKHPKRWQDVIELLNAGIDVYSALNVQHLESRKDVVEGITNITVHETVPDVILERANSIELIDIPPPELLQRLKEGKVYIGEQSKRAAENFFQEDHLTALREISLRFTAEKVDHDLHGMFIVGKAWKTHEKVMVAVTSAPSSQQLIRAARRLAFELDAPWIALHIDSGLTLNVEDQARLNKHLQLAQELGAEVVTVYEIDIPTAIRRIAQQKDVTRLVMGRPAKQDFISSLFKKSFLQRLEEENPQIDILIHRQDKLTGVYKRTIEKPKLHSSAYSYLGAVLTVVLITLIGFPVADYLEYKTVGLLYLLNILFVGLFSGIGPLLLAALFSVLAWDFFFISHTSLLASADVNDLIMVAIYFMAALTMGFMNNLTLKRENFLFNREKRMERLYEIMREIATSANFVQLRENVCTKLQTFFGAEFGLLIKNSAGQLVFDESYAVFADEKERVAAVWTFEKKKLSGHGTDTLPSAQGIYFPIAFANTPIGVLYYLPPPQKHLSPEDINLLQVVTEQLGNYLGAAEHE